MVYCEIKLLCLWNIWYYRGAYLKKRYRKKLIFIFRVGFE